MDVSSPEAVKKAERRSKYVRFPVNRLSRTMSYLIYVDKVLVTSEPMTRAECDRHKITLAGWFPDSEIRAFSCRMPVIDSLHADEKPEARK